MLRNLWLVIGVVVVLIAVGLLIKQALRPSSKYALPPPPTTPVPTAEPTPESSSGTSGDPTQGKAPYSEGDPFVLISTTKGDMYAEIYQDLMPRTARNFLDLVKSGFYNGSAFHRVVPGFVIQGGASAVPPVSPLQFEECHILHDRGVLSMARVGNDFNSATTSFFICLDRAKVTDLDGSYDAFGRVLVGMEAADAITKAAGGAEFPTTPEKMTAVRIVGWEEVKKHLAH